MHYYQFNIGDYIKDTAHLDLIEDAIYRRLLDHYYMTESPIQNETQTVIKRLRLGSVEVILQSVLSEFFHLNPDDNCWHHTRCDKEIAAYRKRCDINKKVGKLGGRPRKTESVSCGFPEKTLTNNQEPITNNQEPIKKEKNSRFAPPSLDEVREYIQARGSPVDPESFMAFYTSNGWKVGKNVMKDWRACITTWEKRNETNRRNGKISNAEHRQNIGNFIEAQARAAVTRLSEGAVSEDGGDIPAKVVSTVPK